MGILTQPKVPLMKSWKLEPKMKERAKLLHRGFTSNMAMSLLLE